MSLTHTNASPLFVRNGLADFVVDLIDGGTTDTTGDLVIMAAADAEVATLSWSATPAFGAAASGTATMNAINDDTSATGGTAIAFKFQDRDNREIFRGAVATSGSDLNLSSTSIGAGDTVSITSFTYSSSV